MTDDTAAQEIEAAAAKQVEHFATLERQCGIPEHCVGGLARWIVYGIRPGSFLQYIVENNMADAIGHADDVNKHALPYYARFLFSHAPIGSWRHLEDIESWRKSGGLRGRAMAALEAETSAPE